MTIDEIIKHCDDYITSMNKYADTGNIGWWLEFYHTVLNGFRELKALEEQQDVHDNCKKCIEFSEFEKLPRWVPVIERLPKPQEIVIVTTKRWGHHDNDLFENLPEYAYSTYFACYNPYSGFNDDVVAWMSLPEPYKEEQDE